MDKKTASESCKFPKVFIFLHNLNPLSSGKYSFISFEIKTCKTGEKVEKSTFSKITFFEDIPN